MNEEPTLTRPHIATLCAALAASCACAGAAVADETAQQPAGGTAAAASTPTLSTRPGELLGRVLRFRGAVADSHAGRTVRIQRLSGDGWVPTASATVASDGTFLARWRTDEVGRFTVRALVAAAEAQVAAAPPTTQVTVYRAAVATWYGPGFYGRRTACGQRLTRALLGVAHRTLPCGTPVAIFLGGRSITVPVVDRGPFGTHARYDLTAAAARQLGMTVTTRIGVAPQRGRRMAVPAPAPGPVPTDPTGGSAYSAAADR